MSPHPVFPTTPGSRLCPAPRRTSRVRTLTAWGGPGHTGLPDRWQPTPHCVWGVSSGCLWASHGAASTDPRMVPLQAWAPTGITTQHSGFNLSPHQLEPSLSTCGLTHSDLVTPLSLRWPHWLGTCAMGLHLLPHKPPIPLGSTWPDTSMSHAGLFQICHTRCNLSKVVLVVKI